MWPVVSLCLLLFVTCDFIDVQDVGLLQHHSELDFVQRLTQKSMQGIGVYGTCPGYVATDLTKGGGFKSVTEGVDTPVWLCLQPIGSIPEGALFAERSVVPW